MFREEGLAKMEKDRPDRWMEMGVGGQGNARQEKSVPGRRTEEQVHLKVSPAHARGNHWLSGLGAGGDTALQRRGVGGGWGPGHPPLFADKQEQKHNQARDEGQADPDNGPRVVAGPCRGS